MEIEQSKRATRRRPNHAVTVLPLYGEGNGVPSVVGDLAVAAYALRAREIELELLLVDGTQGRVAHPARDLAVELDLPTDVIAGPSGGAGAAYLEGFRWVCAEGRADLLVTLDANGRHDAGEIPRLIDRLVEQDLDVVIGSRWTRGSGTPGLSPSRWVLGRAANLLFRVLTGTRGIADATTSFRVARIQVVQDFRLGDVPANSHSLQTTFVADAVAKGYRVGEASIVYRPPIDTGGGLSRHDVREFAGHLVHLRRRVDRVRQRRLSMEGRRFTDDHFGAVEDIERLGTAKYFFDWVLDEFDPYLRGRVLEVGAGLGTITRKLVERYPQTSIVAIEPAANMFTDLRAYAALTPQVEAYKQTLERLRPPGHGGFDVALYLNVLEHIEDDGRELTLAAKALRSGGVVLVFAPALEWLYSELDHRAGHYRRYDVGRLGALARGAGLEVVSIRYFDVLGVLPYYLVYRMLGHTGITGSTLWGYDRLVVPLSRLVQRAVPRPLLGKNIILVARKP